MLYPALDVAEAEGDMVLALADEFSPTAVEDHNGSFTIFFSDRSRRDAASEAIARRWPNARLTAREVDDEDWARRSQEGLQPITVGRITIVPNSKFLIPNSSVVVIEPSMGFGTGHHATTGCAWGPEAIDLRFLFSTSALDRASSRSPRLLGAGRAVASTKRGCSSRANLG